MTERTYAPAERREEGPAAGQRVSTPELFFAPVFVFVFIYKLTQVTVLLAHDMRLSPLAFRAAAVPVVLATAQLGAPRRPPSRSFSRPS